MKKLSALLVILLGMSFAAVPAHATGGYHGGGNWYCKFMPWKASCKKAKKQKIKKYKKYKCKKYPWKCGKKPKPHAVPEIDAAGAAIALAMLAGVVSIGRERRRKAAK